MPVVQMLVVPVRVMRRVVRAPVVRSARSIERDSVWGCDTDQWLVVLDVIVCRRGTHAGGNHIGSLARRTRRCSRPLRARDRTFFGRWFGGALAAAERQPVGPLPPP